MQFYSGVELISCYIQRQRQQLSVDVKAGERATRKGANRRWPVNIIKAGALGPIRRIGKGSSRGWSIEIVRGGAVQSELDNGRFDYLLLKPYTLYKQRKAYYITIDNI